MTISKNTTIPSLGADIKQLRKKHYPNDDQKTFAFRIKVSRATYQKMEKGDLSVSMNSYYAVAKFLDMEENFSVLLKPKKEKIILIKELNL